MPLSRAFMLERCRARDARYDGRFLLGVLTTGIYCLPSCPARDPKAENVRFFSDEASARAAGLRACRRCHPDDFYRGHQPDVDDAEGVAGLVRADPSRVADAAELRRLAGLGATKLAALFRDHFHTTPAAFLARARVDAACRRLLATDARVLDVGQDVGFESSSAFHENFRRLTGLAPRAYRELRTSDELVLELPADYRAEEALDYLGRDPEGALERRTGRRVEKALVLDGRTALLELELAPRRARVRLGWDRRPAPRHRAAAHRAAVRMLGLASDPRPFERRVSRVLGLGRLIRGRRGLRIPLTADPFEALVWSVVGQQVNLAFAQTLRRRLAERVGRRHRGRLVHPTPADVAALDPDDLRPDQLSARKARYLVDLAAAVAGGALDLEALGRASARRAEERLLAHRGIGPWAANYVRMRGLGLADCVPVGDTGLTAGLQRLFELPERPGPEETRTLMAPFAPFRSLATRHVWKFLEESPQRTPETRP